jgi:hypothetical protein
LVDQDGAEGEALGGDEPAGGHLAQAAEGALELTVEVLQGVRAQLVEDAADPDAVVGVRVGAAPGRDQDSARGRAQRVQVGSL